MTSQWLEYLPRSAADWTVCMQTNTLCEHVNSMWLACKHPLFKVSWSCCCDARPLLPLCNWTPTDKRKERGDVIYRGFLVVFFYD